jgi:hypothetical protein
LKAASALGTDKNAPNIVWGYILSTVDAPIEGEGCTVSSFLGNSLGLIGEALRAADRVSKDIRTHAYFFRHDVSRLAKFLDLPISNQLAQYAVRMSVRTD